jgi:hypothetical protein
VGLLVGYGKRRSQENDGLAFCVSTAFLSHPPGRLLHLMK